MPARILALPLALALSTTSAYAGSLEPAWMEPEVTAPVKPVRFNDWTGFYGGVELGYTHIDAAGSGTGDGISGGVFLGYDHDYGDWVLGVGADYDVVDIRLGRTEVESIWRLRLRGGYKVGDGLIYGVGGYFSADTDIFGSDGSYFVGAGYDHMITDRFSLGAEVLYHDIERFGPTITDLGITTVQVRGAFRF